MQKVSPDIVKENPNVTKLEANYGQKQTHEFIHEAMMWSAYTTSEWFRTRVIARNNIDVMVRGLGFSLMIKNGTVYNGIVFLTDCGKHRI
jgi:hypothetical protein